MRSMPGDGAAPDPELFREVFGRFATGVAVITSAGAGSAGGMTANALCSLSLDPLLALVCFENRARTLPIVRGTECVRDMMYVGDRWRSVTSMPRREQSKAVSKPEEEVPTTQTFFPANWAELSWAVE